MATIRKSLLASKAFYPRLGFQVEPPFTLIALEEQTILFPMPVHELDVSSPLRKPRLPAIWSEQLLNLLASIDGHYLLQVIVANVHFALASRRMVVMSTSSLDLQLEKILAF